MRWLLVALVVACSARVQAEQVVFGLEGIRLHLSDPQQSSRTDCSAELLGLGAYLEWRSLEVEGSLGTRRERCGANRAIGGGGFLAVKWRPRVLRWSR